jgi:hypothetical protein
MQYPCLVGSIWAESGQKIVQYGTLLGVQGDSPDEAEANARLIAAAPEGYQLALDYERWEADVILNADWSGETPRLRQDQWDRLIQLQEARNTFLAKARGDA